MAESLYHIRRNPRADFHDYSGGLYFITICTQHSRHFFGKISDGEMHFTPLGEFCNLQISALPTHYPYITVLNHVVMPNHVHAIIQLDENHASPNKKAQLSVVVRGFKASVTRFARINGLAFGWQRSFHDHIIRDSAKASFIDDYINNNVTRWSTDKFFS